MKYLFLATFVLLVLLSIGTYWSYPDVSGDVPVIYWVSDPNPARVEQIDLFRQWLVKQGRTTDEGEPIVELRLDAANAEITKVVIQGVSGVAGDIIDIHGCGPMLHYYQAIGLLEEITGRAKEMGFDRSQTYPAIESEIAVDGRQYAFPCNVHTQMYWVNKATLARYGVPVPPSRWTFEEFERLGKQFVAAANQPGERQTRFYADIVDLTTMHRSLGLSVFNETMTRCTLDDERFIRCLKLQYKWTFEDHLLPSAADLSSVATQAGYGGAAPQLFNEGHYAMFRSGRYALIQLRRFGSLELAVVEPPHGGFPNTMLGSRAASISVGGKHKDLAAHFLAFLASEDYNMQIVRDVDGLPPNPVFAQTEAFLRPPDHPNEWGCHEMFDRSAREIAMGSVNSPFVLSGVVARETAKSVSLLMNHRASAEQLAAQLADRINGEIDRTLADDPSLRPLYDRLAARQAEIDRLRAAGEPVPLAWITNPFHRRYYTEKGWAAP